jgi:pimeloyl-ACP methyl ester carboxylesterase
MTDDALLSTLFQRRWTPRAARAAGEAALLLHGAESHTGWFNAVGEALAEGGLTAVAYDRQGWGQSPGPLGRLARPGVPLTELGAMVRSLSGEFQKLHLVGLSWGGMLAACAREAMPDRFATVTLLAPAIFAKRRPSLFGLLKGLRGALVPLPLFPGDFTNSPERQAWVAADLLRTTAVGLEFCRATVELTLRARRQFLTASGPPAQVLLASEDTVIDGPRTRRFAERRGAQVAVLPRTAHSLVLDDPGGVARMVLAFANRGGAAPRARDAS